MGDESETPKEEKYSKPSDITRWAFDIHKDADAILHTRLQGFLAFNALLAGGFFATLIALERQSALIIPAVLACFVGLLIALLFRQGIGRIVTGILHLKKTYLLNDEIYEAYYGPIPPNVRGDRLPGYGFAKNIPIILANFWSLALVLAFGLYWWFHC